MLCDKWNMPLFKVRPDLFPEGRLTHLEIELWVKYYTEQRMRREAMASASSPTVPQTNIPRM